MPLELRRLTGSADRAAARLFPTAPRAFAGATGLAFGYGIAASVFNLLPFNDALSFAVVLAAIFVVVSRCHARKLALHLVVQILVLASVFHLWLLGYEGRSAVFGGILPWSDSFDFLNDALRLMHGHVLDSAAKRPLYPVALSGLLRITGGDVRLVLLLFAAFAAWAIALATNAVWDTHGRRAALIVFALLLLSERHWSGFFQTEDLGLPLGLIGFTLIWRAAAGQAAYPERAFAAVLAGLFAITMALMARAGAFFVLPALAIWAALHQRPASLSRLSALALAGAAIVAGAGVHELVLGVAANGASFSDYPPIVFGLIHHRDFTYLIELHPELKALGGAARALASWKIVGAEAMAHPGLVATGFLRSFAEAFYTPNGLFGFVWHNPDDIVLENGPAVRAALAQYGVFGPVILWVKARGLYSLFNALTMGAFAVAFVAAAIAALIALIRRPGGRFQVLLRYAVVGLLLSLPFLPPWITQDHQVQVATIAFLAAAVGTWRLGGGHDAVPAAPGLLLVPPVAGIGLIGAALLLTALPARVPDCGGCHAMRIIPGTAVVVGDRRTLSLATRARDDLVFSLQYLNKHNAGLVQSLAPDLRLGTRYVLAYDARDATAKILIDPAQKLHRDGWQSVEAAALIEPKVMRVTQSQMLAPAAKRLGVRK